MGSDVELLLSAFRYFVEDDVTHILKLLKSIRFLVNWLVSM